MDLAVTSSRQTALPFDHLEAEVAVFPLASEAALRLALTELDPFLGGATGELWREAERGILGNAPGLAVDELVAMRDRAWFGPPVDSRCDRPLSLGLFLVTLARLALEVHGATARPRPTSSPSRGPAPPRGGLADSATRARMAWRWLSFALPPDLLLAALRDDARFPVAVETLSPQFAHRMLDHGYAETHLHLGAALEFGDLWVLLQRAIADAGVAEDAFRSPGALLSEGRDFAPWLVRGALVRYVLAAYLARASENGALSTFVSTVVSPTVERRLGIGAFADLRAVLDDLACGIRRPSPVPFARIRALYSMITAVRALPVSRSLDELQRCDPIARLWPPAPNGATAEMRWVNAGLSYLRRCPLDRAFARLFWQVVRVRVLFYRHVVQRPMTPGLQWFVRFFDRIKAARGKLAVALRLRSAARLSGHGQGLRSLELRQGPDRNASSLFREMSDAAVAIREQARQSRGAPQPFECGFVLSFQKERGGQAAKGRATAHWQATNADPLAFGGRSAAANPTGYRYASHYCERLYQALAIEWLLRSVPSLLYVVRGVDVCTDELGVPTWVVVPLFQRVRRAGEQASRALRLYGHAVPPLGATAHVGEDFVHLLGGLRRIDEALDFLNLRNGDRIGHALALGVDPHGWANETGRATMLLEDRLLDLVWEWSWYARGEAEAPVGRAVILDREIARLSQTLVGSRLAPSEAERRVHLLHSPHVLDRLGFPWGHLQPRPKALKGVYDYLTDPVIFRRGRTIITVDTRAEAEALATLQNALRRKVGRRGVTVEVNPSSNLLIGHLDSWRHHPLWRLNPPVPDPAVPPVAICVGSDDPLTFATNVRLEYQHLLDGLSLAGFSDDQAREWLEHVRCTSLDARFTLPLPVAARGGA